MGPSNSVREKSLVCPSLARALALGKQKLLSARGPCDACDVAGAKKIPRGGPDRRPGSAYLKPPNFPGLRFGSFAFIRFSCQVASLLVSQAQGQGLSVSMTHPQKVPAVDQIFFGVSRSVSSSRAQQPGHGFRVPGA